jgi:hypothetical protein
MVLSSLLVLLVYAFQTSHFPLQTSNFTLQTSLLPARNTDVSRDKLRSIADLEQLALFAMVSPAQRNNIPAVVSRAVCLDERSHFRRLRAFPLHAVLGNSLAAVFFPVIKPASARAGAATHIIDVFYLHGLFSFEFVDFLRDRQLRYTRKKRSHTKIAEITKKKMDIFNMTFFVPLCLRVKNVLLT